MPRAAAGKLRVNAILTARTTYSIGAISAPKRQKNGQLCPLSSWTRRRRSGRSHAEEDYLVGGRDSDRLLDRYRSPQRCSYHQPRLARIQGFHGFGRQLPVAAQVLKQTVMARTGSGT